MNSTHLETAPLYEVIHHVMRRSFNLGHAGVRTGMSIEEVENEVRTLFEGVGVYRRVTDVGTTLADHTGDKGHRLFSRVRRGVYTITAETTQGLPTTGF